MLLRQLSSLCSSFCPRGHPALYQAGFRGSIASFSFSQFIPTLPPWWSVQGFPPWPPRLPRSHPSAHQVFTPHSRNINPGSIGSCSCFHTSEGQMMERDREPPHKRKKSGEEREGLRGGPPKATGGQESKRERHHPDFRKDGNLRPNHFKDGSRDRTKNDAEKSVGRENSSGKDVERTKTWKGWYRKDDRNPSHPHPAGSRTQTPKLNPEMDPVSEHKPKHWHRGRGAEEQGGVQRNTTGPPEQPKEGRKWTGPPSKSPNPSWPSHPQNPWQVVGANRPPPPPGMPSPGMPPPVKPLQRHWEACHAEPLPPGDSAVFDFSVMSYNILSQELLQDNAYLYRHCDPGILPWDYRLPNLLAEIQQHDADILCLQEVQMDHYEQQIKPALQALGYHCEFKKRTGRKPDGCAIIFKTSRFSLLSANPVEFFRHGDALLDRDNVGLVVLLQPKNSISQSDASSFICVANTHLLYNPRRGDIKLAQLAILLAEIYRLSRLPDGSANPVVLCGDFNSAPCSPLYSFMTTGCLEYEGLQISMVSGQESSPRGQRLLTPPIWSRSLGINLHCQYESKPRAEPSPSSPTVVEGGISNLRVEDLATSAATAASNSAKIEHSLQLQSSYKHHLASDGRPEITTCHSRTALTVDYILFSPDSNTTDSLPGGRGLQLLGRLSLVGQSELEEIRGLPNQHHSSDHLPLLASFRFSC